MATRRPAARKAPQFVFEFLGFNDGWYALRADLTLRAGHGRLDAHTFENVVFEWLITQHITPNKHAYIGNGNTGKGPRMPATPDGSRLCVLLKRAVDVLRFEQRFPCKGITPDAILTALRAESRTVRFAPEHIAQVVYEANSKLNGLSDGEKHPAWSDTAADYRKMVLTGVQLRLDHPDWTAENLHDFWLQDRLAQGWTYGPKRDHVLKTHPSLVPFDHLSVLEQVKDHLFSAIVKSMMPLLETP